jgi:membrane protease YdiL (CAAX protease family)
VAPLLLAAAAAVPIALTRERGDAQTAVFFAAGITMYPGLLVVFYLQAIRSGLLTSESLGLRLERVRPALLWGAAGAGGMALVGAVNELIVRALGLPTPQGDVFEWLRTLPLGHFLIVAFAGAVVAPIVEELFFRGYVFHAYLAEKGVRTAYVGSAAIFSAVHGELTLLVGFFFMGLVLAYLYRRTGSIIAPVFAHLLNNSLAFISLLATMER